MKYHPQTKECPSFDLRAWREIHKMSYKVFAKMVGLDPSYIYRLEKGMYTASFKTARNMFEKMRQYDKQNPTNNYMGLPIF